VLRLEAYRLALDAEEAVERVQDGDADTCAGARVVLSRAAAESHTLSLYTGQIGVLKAPAGPGCWLVYFPGMEVHEPEVEAACGAGGRYELVHAVSRLERELVRSRAAEVEAQRRRQKLEEQAGLTADPVERARLAAEAKVWRRTARLARRDCDRELEAVERPIKQAVTWLADLEHHGVLWPHRLVREDQPWCEPGRRVMLTRRRALGHDARDASGVVGTLVARKRPGEWSVRFPGVSTDMSLATGLGGRYDLQYVQSGFELIARWVAANAGETPPQGIDVFFRPDAAHLVLEGDQRCRVGAKVMLSAAAQARHPEWVKLIGTLSHSMHFGKWLVMFPRRTLEHISEAILMTGRDALFEMVYAEDVAAADAETRLLAERERQAERRGAAELPAGAARDKPRKGMPGEADDENDGNASAAALAATLEELLPLVGVADWRTQNHALEAIGRAAVPWVMVDYHAAVAEWARPELGRGELAGLRELKEKAALSRAFGDMKIAAAGLGLVEVLSFAAVGGCGWGTARAGVGLGAAGRARVRAALDQQRRKGHVSRACVRALAFKVAGAVVEGSDEAYTPLLDCVLGEAVAGAGLRDPDEQVRRAAGMCLTMMVAQGDSKTVERLRAAMLSLRAAEVHASVAGEGASEHKTRQLTAKLQEEHADLIRQLAAPDDTELVAALARTLAAAPPPDLGVMRAVRRCFARARDLPGRSVVTRGNASSLETVLSAAPARRR
jgi:hypothetical protein